MTPCPCTDLAYIHYALGCEWYTCLRCHRVYATPVERIDWKAKHPGATDPEPPGRPGK